MTGPVTSGNRLSRLLALVPWLIAHDGVTITAAAEHFGVTPEQLESDLWLLVVCGLPGYGPDQLVDIDFWEEGRIHVIDPQTLRRPLRISPDEAMSMLVALRLLAQVPGSHDRAALISATARLEEAVGSVTGAVIVDNSQSDQILAEVSSALGESRELIIEYGGAGDDSISERVIHPLRLESHDGCTYLEAFCMSAGAVRTFRLDRMVTAVMGEVFTPDVDDSPHPSDQSDNFLTARLILQPSVRWALDVHPMVVRVELPDGSVQIDIDVYEPAWLVRLVLSLRGEAELISPPELRESVADAARVALSAYAS